MIKKTIWILLAVSVLAFVGTTVRADERNKQSKELANAPKAVVPPIAIDVMDLSLTDLETVPIVAVTPDEKDAITAVIRSRPLPNIAALVSAVGPAGVGHPVQ